MRKRKSPEGLVDEKTKFADEILQQIAGWPHRDLIRIGGMLLEQDWPDPLPRPQGWAHLSPLERLQWTDCIIRIIARRTGMKALYRYQFLYYRRATEQEFEDWWESGRAPRTDERIYHTNLSATYWSGFALAMGIMALILSIAAMIIRVVQ